LQSGGESSILLIMPDITNHKMNKAIKEAVEVSVNLYENVDAYKLSSGDKIKHLALGQCLRSMVELLENELRNNQSPAT
jgi:hypothetical protein